MPKIISPKIIHLQQELKEKQALLNTITSFKKTKRENKSEENLIYSFITDMIRTNSREYDFCYFKQTIYNHITI